MGKEHMGGSRGQELPFPCASRNNGLSLEQGQKGRGPAADGGCSWHSSGGSCREHVGPQVLLLQRNFPQLLRSPQRWGSGPQQLLGWGQHSGGTGAARAGPRSHSAGVRLHRREGTWGDPRERLFPWRRFPVRILGCRFPCPARTHPVSWLTQGLAEAAPAEMCPSPPVPNATVATAVPCPAWPRYCPSHPRAVPGRAHQGPGGSAQLC